MISRLLHTVVLLAAAVAGLAGCAAERDEATLFAPESVGVLVVDGTLIVGEGLPVIRLSRTQAPDAVYDPAVAAVRDATMEVARLFADGSVARTFTYAFFENERAWYGTGDPELVLPRTTYTVTVTTPQGETLTARTTTPDRFTIDSWVLLDATGTVERRQLQDIDDLGEAVYDHPDNQLDYADGLLDAYFTAAAADVGAFGFQVGIFSLDPDAGFVIDPPFFEPEDFEDLPRTGSSPIFEGTEGFVRLPWFAVYYDGRHLVKTYAVDRNWYDLVRTTPEGGGLFGGNLGEGQDPPTFHVTGGIGLFGSASVDENGFRINPVE